MRLDESEAPGFGEKIVIITSRLQGIVEDGSQILGR